MKKSVILVLACLSMTAGVFGFKSTQTSETALPDVTTLSGNSYSWETLNDQWVVVNYFAEWCAPCLKELPELNAFAQYAAKQPDITFLAVNYDSSEPDELQRLKDTYGIEFELALASPDAMPTGKPRGLPATFVISPESQQIKALYGEQTDSGLRQTIAQLKGL